MKELKAIIAVVVAVFLLGVFLIGVYHLDGWFYKAILPEKLQESQQQ